MKINILCVGRLKERYWREAADEYLKRLSGFAELTVTEIASEKGSDPLSASDIAIIRRREGARIASAISERDCVIALCVDGKEMPSEGFASLLQTAAAGGFGRIVFVIGGSVGLSDEVIKRANWRVSFSKMTFPHQMMRVILLEQLYRAFKIISGGSYHK